MGGASAPIEVTIRLYGLKPGESEVAITIPDGSELGRLLDSASPQIAQAVFARLRRQLTSELNDAFRSLEGEPSPSRAPTGNLRR